MSIYPEINDQDPQTNFPMLNRDSTGSNITLLSTTLSAIEIPPVLKVLNIDAGPITEIQTRLPHLSTTTTSLTDIANRNDFEFYRIPPNYPTRHERASHLCYIPSDGFVSGFSIIYNRRLSYVGNSNFTRSSRVVPAVNGETIVTGGNRDPFQAYRINLVTQEAIALASLPTPTYWHCFVRYGEECWIIGTGPCNNRVLRLSSIYDIWREAPSLNVGRLNSSAAEHNGILYIAGGQSIGEDRIKRQCLASIEQFNGTEWELLQIRLQ